MEEFLGVRFKQRAVTEFLTVEKVPPIEIHRWMQAVYGEVCRWEYSKTLGKAVKRWRIGGKKIWVTKHEMEGVWLQVVSFIKIALKNWSAKSVASNKKKLPLHENF